MEELAITTGVHWLVPLIVAIVCPGIIIFYFWLKYSNNKNALPKKRT